MVRHAISSACDVHQDLVESLTEIRSRSEGMEKSLSRMETLMERIVIMEEKGSNAIHRIEEIMLSIHEQDNRLKDVEKEVYYYRQVHIKNMAMIAVLATVISGAFSLIPILLSR